MFSSSIVIPSLDPFDTTLELLYNHGKTKELPQRIRIALKQENGDGWHANETMGKIAWCKIVTCMKSSAVFHVSGECFESFLARI